MSNYSIAGYTIKLSSFPAYMEWDNFERFACLDPEPDISFEIVSHSIDTFCNVPGDAEKLVDSSVHKTYRYSGATHFFQTPDDIVSYVRATGDYSECILNIEPKYYDNAIDSEMKKYINDAVMFDMRKMLTGKLALGRGLCIHSCVAIYDGFGVLFSAATETGKSTHAHLWQEVYPETEIVNGDNGFCRMLDNVPYVFGAPWCGNSNECLNRSAPIKAIVFLEQAQDNNIEKLDQLNAFMRLAARCYMPLWDEVLVSKSMDTVESMTKKVDCYLLKCLPNQDAARLAHDEIFKH